MQCPQCNKGKEPAVNTIRADIQQVTTRSKKKNTKWKEQDDICKAAQAWEEKANEANAERMKEESASATTQIEDKALSPNSISQALADCEVTLTMDKHLETAKSH